MTPCLYAESSGSQMGAIFSLRGHWERSGDTFGGDTAAKEWGTTGI